MILVIGGETQGKYKFVVDEILKGKTDVMSMDEKYKTLECFYTSKIMNHFHLIVKRLMEEEYTDDQIEAAIFDIIDRNPNIIIITNEIGYGIVPIEREQRRYREQTGRICCKLAKQAESVYRLTCGIPEKLK